MTHSEQINEIATALAKAQGAMSGAVKDAANPFFKSKYADLASVWEACRQPLSENGLAILQSPEADGLRVTLETLMLHTSGQWFRNTLSVSAKDDSPQAIGSAITYLRRYVLQSFAGVAPEDDDAEAAQGRPNGKASSVKPAQMQAAPEGYAVWFRSFEPVIEQGMDALREAWKTAKPEYRDYLTHTDAKRLDGLKAAAQAVTDNATAKKKAGAAA